MTVRKLLVANRGEIAIRVMRAARDLGIATVAVYSEDDASSLHVAKADVARRLPGSGALAYLDDEAILAVAKDEGCDAIHPGYGFLSENAAFAARCRDEGITFVGPLPETLALFGDKLRARALAEERGVPVLPGSASVETPEDARAFMASLGEGVPIIIKAVAGGGGRGMRIVRDPDEIDEALKRCRSEAQAAFGDGSVYVERLVERARHIEVQIVGDGSGDVVHLWERDCSIQRRHQKLIEIAPAPSLSPGLRRRIIDAALRLAGAAGYASLGTFEFLVDADGPGDDALVAFIEANPRLQVEHTVTEEVTGFDLVQLQLRLASGARLGDLGLTQDRVPEPRGFAIQARVNMETMGPDGSPRPSGGTLSAFDPPSGPGVRTDTFGYAGYRTSPRFDSLLAKVIAHSASPDFAQAVARTYRALSEFRVEGVSTNIPFLQSILHHPDFARGLLYTRFIEDHLPEIAAAAGSHPALYLSAAPAAGTGAEAAAGAPGGAQPVEIRRAGAQVDRRDPLAVLVHGKTAVAAPAAAGANGTGDAARADGLVPVTSALQGTVVAIDVAVGHPVRAGQQVLVMEAMKMEHPVTATVSGIVREVAVAIGDAIYEGTTLVRIEEQEVDGAALADEEDVDLDAIRPDLAEILDRHALTRDDARPEAIAARHEKGQRTARENIADLCDPDSFVEYGALGLPTGFRRPIDEIARRYPADGMVTGIGAVNGALFPEPTSRTAVLSYDYTVLAGTQGGVNHRKTDRLLEVAGEWQIPVVLFTEGGGGRSGQRDPRPEDDGQRMLRAVGGPQDVPTWRRLAALSGLVPIVGINSGWSFAGNAALLGCCDVIIATANSSIGMGGPAMVEGGGLGIYRPDEIGPMSVQVPNGVVDIAVADEAEGVAAAKQYLSYFQGPLRAWEAHDQRVLRRIVPENRLRVYDVRRVIETIADVGSVLELRPKFGQTMVTALIRIEGRAVGVIANNPQYLSGAVDSDGADKAARFMKVCDAFDLPILSLCDTPGIMVGPEAEKTGTVRHAARMFVTGSNITVPLIAVVLRKSIGLGVMTMAGATFKSTTMALSWPTGEFAGMGLEGQVKLGHRAELAAIEDVDERRRRYDEILAAAYESARALHQGVSFGVDDVIDPADTRAIVARVFASVRQPARRERKKWPSIDTW